MTDLGKLNYFLGLQVTQRSDGIFITQKKYTEDLLKQYGMHQCKPEMTPMNANERLQFTNSTESADVKSYRSLVGKLLYLTHTRPDISFAVGMFSWYLSKPTKQHLSAGKRILRYLAGTTELGLWYTHSAEWKLEGYSDCDWEGSLEDRKSTTGIAFKLGSTVVSWGSRKQDTTALSTTKVSMWLLQRQHAKVYG